MGCCGQTRKVNTYAAPKIISKVVRRASRNPHPTIRKAEIGTKCKYCGTVVTEKVKRTNIGWVRTGWCSKCRLEM